MKTETKANGLVPGDEFIIVSRGEGLSKISKTSYLAVGEVPSIQLNNSQIIGRARDGSTISIGQNTRVKKLTSQGLLTN